MTNDSSPNPLSLVSTAGKLYRMREGYKFVFIWTFFGSLWTIIVGAATTIYLFVPKVYDGLLIDIVVISIIFLGIPLLVTSFTAIAFARRGYNKLGEFVSDFYPIWVKTRLELLPPIKGTVEEQLVRKVKEIAPLFINDISISKQTEDGNGFETVVTKKKNAALIKVIEEDSELHDGNIQQDIVGEILKSVKDKKLNAKLIMIVAQSKSIPTWGISDLNMEVVPKTCTIIFMNFKDNKLDVERIYPPKKL